MLNCNLIGQLGKRAVGESGEDLWSAIKDKKRVLVKQSNRLVPLVITYVNFDLNTAPRCFIYRRFHGAGVFFRNSSAETKAPDTTEEVIHNV